MDARVSAKPEDEVDDGQITKLIKSLQDRAQSLRATAMAILAVIGVLLVGGAAIFVLAPQITFADFNQKPDFDKAAAELERQRQQVDSQLATLMPPIRNNCETLRVFFNENRVQEPPDVDLTLGFDGSSVKPIVDGLAQVKGKVVNLTLECRLIQTSAGFGVRAEDGLIAGLTQLSFVPTQQASEIEKIVSRRDPLSMAIDTIKRDKTATEVAQLTHTLSAGSDNQRQEVPLAQIIQTNVTRFGTIIMIIFLVTILTPLYRYNLRLASYYEARADALILMDTKLKSAGFVRLVGALTPTLDFGKAPPTPIEQLVELVKETGTKANSKTGT